MVGILFFTKDATNLFQCLALKTAAYKCFTSNMTKLELFYEEKKAKIVWL